MTQCQFTEEEETIFEKFHWRCVRCVHQAVTLHEIEPRSHGGDALREENRVPVCASCHDWAHRIGTRVSIPVLKEYRLEALKRYGGE